MINTEEFYMIGIMYRQGWAKKRIARALKISINTVRRHVRLDKVPSYRPRATKPGLLTPYHDIVSKRLHDAEPHWIPATVILREIQEMGYQGSLSLLRGYMRQLRPQVPTEPLCRFETEPGVQMQVDWAECCDGDIKMSAFVSVLGYSRAGYVCFVANKQSETLLSCHEQAFAYFGGVTDEVLYDNMKTVIVTRNHYGAGQHRLQPAFWDFAKHYGFHPKVCRPYRAQTKGKVERFIHYLKHSFFYPLAREARAQGIPLTLDLANSRVHAWLDTVANRREHGTTKCIPMERLRQEQPYLKPLPHVHQRGDRKTQELAAIWIYQPMHENIQHDLAIYQTVLESQEVHHAV